jgi:hypothetical protein
MGFVPDKSFPFKLIYEGVLYEGRILPLREEGQPFPDHFKILVWGEAYAEIRYGSDGWVADNSDADPDVVQKIGEHIQARYE